MHTPSITLFSVLHRQGLNDMCIISLHTVASIDKSKCKTDDSDMVLAFFSVLFTYFGVNFFLSGMHSYA